jgi:hypothetical protein
MTAKHKLNAAYVIGALVLAGLAGIASNSFLVFWVAFVGLLIADVVAGHIRA